MTVTRTAPLVLALLMAAAPAAAEPVETVTVAAYNLENAFDVWDDPYTDDEGTPPKARAAWQKIASVIKATDADVVAFSEVENEWVLRAMAANWLPDAGYKHFAVPPTNDGRGIHLGVMSRLPIRRVASYRHRTFTLPGDPQKRTWRMSRDILHVTLALDTDAAAADDAETLELLAVHLKSKRSAPDGSDEKSASRRLAEAMQVAKIVAEIREDDPDARVAAVGDFNDTPGSPPVEHLVDRGLVDVHADLPAEDRGTYLVGDFRGTTIDYIFATPNLADGLLEAWVVDDEALTSGSDHAAVVASFDLAAEPAGATSGTAADTVTTASTD